MKIYDIIAGKDFESSINLDNLLLKLKAIPKENNMKMIFEDFEVTIGIEEKIPLFLITQKEKVLVTGIIVFDDYIKNKVIRKLQEEAYNDEFIEHYRSLPVETLVYISRRENAIKMVEDFLNVLLNIDIQ